MRGVLLLPRPKSRATRSLLSSANTTSPEGITVDEKKSALALSVTVILVEDAAAAGCTATPNPLIAPISAADPTAIAYPERTRDRTAAGCPPGWDATAGAW